MKKMKMGIYPADHYTPCNDLGIITSYFNPVGYHTRLANYEIFAEKINKSGLHLITVECAFGDEKFTLNSSANTIQLRSNCVLWQKERLLNIAISYLPKSVTKVAWLDCDVLFSNPDWAIETSMLLELLPVVQPFAEAIKLPKGHINYDGEVERVYSFGYVWNTKPDTRFRGTFRRHGHTGFAWAARRSLLEKHGLYDACISGSGDHLMAHAMCGDFNSPCIEHLTAKYVSGNLSAIRILLHYLPRFCNYIDSSPKLCVKSKLFLHFEAWGRPFFNNVQGQVGFIPGSILHLWHGDPENRKYWQRHKELMQFNYDPYTDIRISENGTYEWSSNNIQLHQWAKEYFAHRREDG